MRSALQLRDEGQRLSQYSRNIESLKDRASTTFSALQGIKKVSDRASEIATLADSTRSGEELQAYARELTQLIQQAVQTMNTKYRDQVLFAGTANGQAPYNVTLDAAGNVSAVTYQGNSEVTENEIGMTADIAVDVPGQNNSGSGTRGVVTDSRSGADFFNHLISLQNHLVAGDTAAIAATDRQALAADEENLIYHISNNGAVQTRLEMAAAAGEQRALSIEQSVSREVDADLTQTLVALSQTQTAYQAALQSGAALMQTSLLDFLR
jgi:flagellar hook-associated protein 3 FlgL